MVPLPLPLPNPYPWPLGVTKPLHFPSPQRCPWVVSSSGHMYMAFFIVCNWESQFYAVWHASVFITTIPSIFEDLYHYQLGIAGLHYLTFSVSLTARSQINARYMDWVYKYLKSRNGGVGKPEFRLREFQWWDLVGSPSNWSCVVANIVSGTILLPIRLLISSWSAQNHVFWLVPVSQSPMGWWWSMWQDLPEGQNTGHDTKPHVISPLQYTWRPCCNSFEFEGLGEMETMTFNCPQKYMLYGTCMAFSWP